MSWSPRSWFGASWFGRWFGGDGTYVPPDPWSGKLDAELTLTTALVDVELAERYAQAIQLETVDTPIHLRS